MGPSQHSTLLRFKQLMEDVYSWWLEAMLQAAEDGVNIAAIRLFVKLAVGAGADQQHPKIIRTLWLAENRAAAEILREAKELQQNDSATAQKAEEHGGRPLLGLAARASEKIRNAVRNAVRLGVKSKHKDLAEATEIANVLEKLESERRFLSARLQRRAAK